MDRARHLIDEWLLANIPPNNSCMQSNSAQAVVTSQQVVSTNVQQAGRPAVSSDRWQKLQPDRIKCNIDASFSSLWNRTCIGICAC